ncbi:MAG: inverse autotransporter beta domain-containing protein [Chlamydiae bacterium]|nr:inverse autotransporter beta domain-containing protein [Chlamydiota bacterium]
MKFTSFLSSLILFGSFPLVQADQPVENVVLITTEPGLKKASEKCPIPPKITYFEVGHRGPRGVGYSDYYTSINFFGVYPYLENIVPFGDFRSHIFNSGKYALNVGLGMRYLFDTSAVGANIYWDFREGRRTFQQLGLGFEYLFPLYKFWANGYIPLGRLKRTIGIGFDHFEDNQAIVFKRFELPLYGFDLGGAYLLYNDPLATAEVQGGVYYLRGKFREQAGGLFVKLKSRLFEYVYLEGQASYDSHYHWQGNIEIALRAPLGPVFSRKKRSSLSCNDQLAFEYRLIDQPERFEIMPLATHKRTAAADPFFIFVDNTSASNGTFESPFNTLAAAQAASKPGDVIYVFPGDGTTGGMNLGIVLKNGQSLVGSAAPFTLNTRFGTIDIPAQSSARPKITAPLNVVTLANNNLVSGLNIAGFTGVISSFNSNATIKDNVFVSIDASMQLIDIAGNLVITNNKCIDYGTFGIRVFSQINGDLNCTISSNSLSTSIGTAVAGMNLSSRNNGRAIYRIEDNRSEGVLVGTGITTSDIFVDSGEATYLINRNFFEATGSAYSILTGENSVVFASFIQNTGRTTGAVNAFNLLAEGGLGEFRLNSNTAIGGNFGLRRNVSGSFWMQSPNLQLSGVEAQNTGTFTTMGPITFIPPR